MPKTGIFIFMTNLLKTNLSIKKGIRVSKWGKCLLVLPKLDGIDFGSYDREYADPFSVYMRADKSIMIYEMAKKTFTLYPSNPTYKNPEVVTSSHCYQLTESWNPSEYKGYVFKIDSYTQMSVVFSPSGSCPTELPNEQSVTYYR